MTVVSKLCRTMLCGLLLLGSAAAQAQIRTVDPNEAMQQDLAPVPTAEPLDAAEPPPPAEPEPTSPSAAPVASRAATEPPEAGIGTYQENDVLAAAEDVFGRGAEGLAKLIERVLKEQGEPNGYITGREAGGAFVAGVRYGSGTMFHKVEGQRPVYWTGPSIGFDFGANGAKSFVLVYNLYDTQELFHRFPAAEGNVYVVGGFTASYLRRGDVVLIPIRLGVGWRLGANVGYMRFSEESKLLPF